MVSPTTKIIAAAALAASVLGVAAAAPAATEKKAAGAAERELAFRKGSFIYTAREDGTGLRRITRGSQPAYSPDGRRLAFVRLDRIYVASADGRNERRLTSGPGDTWPAWSPDGKRIAFTSRRTGQFEIYVMNADGTNVKRLTFRKRRDEDSVSPAWSPDGKRIAFASNRPTLFNPEIYVMRPDGSGLRRLTYTRGSDAEFGDDGFPSWAPNGKAIVFSSNRTQDGAVWTMQPNGRRQRMLHNITGTDEWYPRVSPDGRRIAFQRTFADGVDEVWIMAANGTGARRLGRGGDPTWRPAVRAAAAVAAVGDGRLAVVSARDGYALVDAKGRTLVRSAAMPAVSSTRLVALASRTGRQYAIKLRALGASRSRTVAVVPGPNLPTLAFSPDGATLVVAGRGRITVVATRSGSARTLVRNGGGYTDIALSPDGRLLAYVHESGNGRLNTLRANLQVVPVAGGPVRTVYRISDPYNFRPRAVFTADGTRLAFLHEDSRIVTVPVTGGLRTPLTAVIRRVTLSNLVALPGDAGYVFAGTPRYGVADIWRVDAAGNVTRLTVTPIPPKGEPHYGTVPLAVSPDGSSILAATGERLAVVPVTGGRPVVLAPLPGPALAAVWLA